MPIIFTTIKNQTNNITIINNNSHFLKKYSNCHIISVATKTLIALIITNILGYYAHADSVAPITTIVTTPSAPNGDNNWYKSYVNVKLTASDLQSGVQKIYYKVNDNKWKYDSFYNNLNLANDGSFEYNTYSYWNFEPLNEQSSINLDYNNKIFDQRSIKINSNTLGWSYISNKNNYIVADPYSTLTVSSFFKTQFDDNYNQDQKPSAIIKIYGVFLDENNNLTYKYLNQSEPINTTSGFNKVFHTFTLNYSDIIGIYLEIGLNNIGSIWVDGVSVTASNQNPFVSLYLNNQGTNTIQYYSIDNNNNIEQIKTANFNIDTIAPVNFSKPIITYDNTNPDQILTISTNVFDDTSGVSDDDIKFQYKINSDQEFGVNQDLLQCNTNWNQGAWGNLQQIYYSNGNNQANLVTPYFNICDSINTGCKVVRFNVKDIAGNQTSKEFCINGSWIRFNQGSKIYSKSGVDILSSYQQDSYLSYIESSNTKINYYIDTSFKKAKNVEMEQNNFEYYKNLVETKEQTNIFSDLSGAYYISGDTTFDNQKSNIDVNKEFNQVLFIDGSLTIESNILINKDSTLILIVKDNVNISKNVTQIDASIITDKTINSAYNLQEDEINYNTSIEFNGPVVATNFELVRNFNINQNPSEIFNYNPKYLIKNSQLINNKKVIWKYMN